MRLSNSGTASTNIFGLATARISSSRSTHWKRRWSCDASTNSARQIRGGSALPNRGWRQWPWQGPARVTIGAPAEFRITVSLKETPYPVKNIDFVKFLVFDSRGEVVLVADAEAAGDGEWVAKVPAETTRALSFRSNHLEVAVASKVVSLASFGSARFVSLGGR